MKPSREIHRGQLARYESELAELKSFIRELKDMTARHGTEREHFEEDLLEAEHNVTYYEGEIARLRKEGGGSPNEGGGRGGGGTILPRTAKQGVGSLLISAISFVAGAILGSRLGSRTGDRDRGEESQDR